MGNLIRNILSQLALNTGEVVTTEVITSSLGLPPGSSLGLLVIRSIVRGAAQTAVLGAYDDVVKRQISNLELLKVDSTFEIAEKTFWEFVEQEGEDNAGYGFDTNSLEYQSALETAEGILMQSMREFEHKKLEVLGRFYGRHLYKGSTQWEKIHLTMKMIDRLTYRQLILIRLICAGFPGRDKEMCITSPDVCVETMDLVTYGIWCAPGAFLDQNNSLPIQLNLLVATDYAKELYDELMLGSIDINEVNAVEATFNIRKSNIQKHYMSTMTIGDIENSTKWHEV